MSYVERDKPTYLTPEGLKKLQGELVRLKKKRIEIAKRIEEAKSLGDLSENADYIKAKEEQSFNEGRIRELEYTLSSLELIRPQPNAKSVQIGSTVWVKDGYNRAMSFTIVGSQEADPSKGFISNESPLGRNFLGKKVKDRVEVKTPVGRKLYTITKIT